MSTRQRHFLKIKEVIGLSRYLLLVMLFLNLFLLTGLSAVPQLDEKDFRGNFTPVIIVVEGGTGPAEEVALHLSQKLVINDFRVTIGITPYLNKKELSASDSLVKELRELYNLYPENIGFALQGLEHMKYELNKSLPEQIHILSRAQSIFTQAFNHDLHDYLLVATTLFPPYGQYNRDIAAAARQAGIKVVVGGDTSGYKDYSLLECDVAEISYDSEVSMITDWQSLKIRSPEELIESMTGALKKSSLENPLVMTINAGILYNQMGTEKAKKYVDTLIPLLGKARQREELKFMTSAEYYRRFIGGKQYIVLRLDDYQTPWKKDLFEKTVNRITELDIPLTISIIPHLGGKLSEDSEAIAYLNSTLEKGLIEVALHGYDHRKGGEFTLPLNEQTSILRKALAESEKILSYDEVFSLVPPHNASNEFTSKAIRTVNKEGHQLRVISADIGDKYMIGFDPEGIYHFSRTIDTMKSYNSPYSLYSVEEIVAAIGYDDTVLNIHAWSLVGKEKQDIIFEVIERLKERPNIEFITLRDFCLNIDPVLRLTLVAWGYFKENTESSTGLVYPSVLINKNDNIYRYPMTTIWEIASSLLGIVSAERLGIISFKEGANRITRILDFLQDCELYQDKYPNLNYSVTTAEMVEENSGVAWNDVARMLVALGMIKTHYPYLRNRCDKVVERWDLTPIKNLYRSNKNKGEPNEIKASPYWNYVNASFGLWGYEDEPASLWTRLKKKMSGLPSPTQLDYYDKLLIPESYLLEAIEMGQTEKNKEILNLIQNLQEARYKDKGIITCLSEGELDREPWFVYCGLVVTEKGSALWPVVRSIRGNSESHPEYRFVSSKAAIAWQVLNENEYTRLCYDLIWEKALNHQFGFYAGLYEESQKINSSLSVNTNGIILESLWFEKRDRKPLIRSKEPEVPEIEENVLSRGKKRIKDFYSYILEKLKIKPEKNLN